MIRKNPRAYALSLTSLVLAALAGCQLPSPVGGLPVVSGNGAGMTSDDTDARFDQRFTVDVDPIHAAAFERPMRQVQTVSVSATMRLAVAFTAVKQDLSTGRTTVTMQLTNAGDAMTYLKCQVTANRKVVTPAWPFNTTAAGAGAMQTVELVFENPSADSFVVSLDFTGILSSVAKVGVGAGTASAMPSTAPTATPTPAPTATPTPAPSAAPSAAAGGWVATASSSYGSLTPDKAIDPDAASQWSNDGYQAAEATWTLDMGASKALSSVALKMKPQSGGATYTIEVSDDGHSFTAVTGPLKNASWNLESKPLPSGTTARFIRLHFKNDPAAPEVRFSVFDVRPNGQGGVVATPAPTPTPGPSGSPVVATSALNNTFEQYAAGSDPTDFIDPRTEGYSYSWMPQVPWRVTSTNGSLQYMHDGLSDTGNLSFRRYAGNGLGTPNGQLPSHYAASVAVTPIKSYSYAPTGDQGTQFYYLDPTHYVEVLIKPSLFEVWVCNGGEPFQSTGWQRVYFTDATTAAGQTRTLGAEVDANAHTLKASLDGVVMTTQSSALITPIAHWLALRGTGNVVVHDNLTITPM